METSNLYAAVLVARRARYQAWRVWSRLDDALYELERYAYSLMVPEGVVILSVMSGTWDEWAAREAEETEAEDHG